MSYRRLLWAYPRAYRQRHGAEIVTTLLDLAEAGRRPGLGLRAHLVLCGLRQRFRLPASLLVQSGSFYLEAHPVGSNEVYRSDPILVNPGNRIIWSLENQLTLSSYRIASGK